MRKITVFTGTRADYGLLYWLMKDIQKTPGLTLDILATGTHLTPEFGLTYREIEKDGFVISEKVEMLLSTDSAVGILKSMGLAAISFSDALVRLQPDFLVILGDRYEALVAAQCALVLQIPILHLHGGEITEGAYDDAIRHSITKMSSLHCVSTSEHRTRVIQLGEQPDTVVNVGALGLEHVHRTKLLDIEELSQSVNFLLKKPFFLVSYHPETLNRDGALKSFNTLLSVLNNYSDFQIILTFPNADNGSRALINSIKTFAQKNSDRVLAVTSLGQLRYLSAMKLAEVVVGNSSSGIIEAPSFKTPTVNIGIRQKGRLCAQSVIHTSAVEEDIALAINKAINTKSDVNKYLNPYLQENTTQKIIDLLVNTNPVARKLFYDIPMGNLPYE